MKKRRTSRVVVVEEVTAPADGPQKPVASAKGVVDLWQALGSAVGEAQFATALGDFLHGAASGGVLFQRAGLERRADKWGGVGLFAARSLPNGFELPVPRVFVLDILTAARTRCEPPPRAQNQCALPFSLPLLLDCAGAGDTTCRLQAWVGSVQRKHRPDTGGSAAHCACRRGYAGHCQRTPARSVSALAVCPVGSNATEGKPRPHGMATRGASNVTRDRSRQCAGAG